MKFDGIKKLTRLSLVLGLSFVSLFLVWMFLGSQQVVTATAPITGDPISTGSSTSLFPSTQPVTSVVSVDLNHDGHEDLAFGEGNNLHILENNSSATSLSWSSTKVISVTNEPISDLAAADFDHDGLADLVIATANSSGTGRVFLLQNPATPFTATWSASKTLIAPASLHLTTVATGDLNGDGAPDVVAAGSDGIIRLWENPATGDFNTAWGSAIQIATGAGKVNQIALVDLDRDGRLDIIAVSGGSPSQVMAWQNPGAPFGGIWSTTNTLGSLGADGLSLAVGDFNNDGAPDVAAGLGNGSVLVWGNPILSGQPFGTSWGSATIVENGTDPVEALRAVDMDNDGYAELVRASGGASPSLVVLYGRRTLFTGAWPSHSIGISGSAFYSLAVGDFDLDGDIDIASGSGDSLLFWPNTLFHRNMPYTDGVVGVMDTNDNSSSSIWATASADLDGDGYPDIVTGGYYSNTGYVLIAWENMGTPFQAGGWTKHTIATLGSAVYSIALGDLDKDGKVDIITGLDSGQLLVWKNDGTPFNGEWTAHSIGTPSERVEGLATGDLDGDGYLDIVTGTGRDEYLSNNNYKVTAWHNSGTPFVGTWANYDVDTVTFSVHSVAIGDLNNDGKPDIVAGVNHAPAVGTPQDPISSTLWIDNYEVRAYQNNGNPFGAAWTRTNVGRDPETESWKQTYHGYWGATVYGVALADLDNDGNMDIVTTDHLEADYQVKVWKNDGTPFSGEEWQATAAGVYSPWMNASVYTVAVGDFNNDGLMDLVTGSGENYETVIWENDGRPFGTTITDTTWIRHNLGLGASNAAFSLAVSDLDRDGDLDITQGSGSYYGPFSTNDVLVWHNRGGAVTEQASLTAPTGMLAGAQDDLMSVHVSHNGKWDDHNAQLVWWRLTLANGNGTPLTGTQAANIFQNFSVYRDTGNGVWNAGDTYIGSVAVNDTTVGSNGVLTFTFPSGSPNTPFAINDQATFFIVAQLQPSITIPTTFQVIFDPDAASLVEDTTTLSSLSIEDTDPVTAEVTVDTPITGLTAKNNSPNSLSIPTMFTATVTGGTSVIYQWTFGDGAYDNGATVTHSYSAGGFYTAVVTATNSLGSLQATTTVTVTNPVPVLSGLSPDTGAAGDPAFTLTVNGSGFASSSTVYWDGSPRPTSMISSTQLTAEISAADIALVGSYPVSVTNPTPGGGTSNTLNFVVNNPVPVLSSLSPDMAIVGGAGFTLKLNGSGFMSGSTVYWDGAARPTSVISSTQLTAEISAADIALVGSYPVTVTNPGPGGGASNALNFEVIAVEKTIYLPIIYR